MPRRAPHDTPPIDQILQGDCIAELRRLPDACVDAVFADPPYNLQLKGALHRPDHSLVDAVDDDWDQFTDFAAYDSFTRQWLAECRRVLKKDGTIWVIGAYHNVFRLGAALQDLNFWVLNDVIWRKANPMPNFRGRRFTNAHETLIWAARGKESKHRFNYQSMKALNDDVQMRSDWFIPLCTGQERLRDEAGAKLHPTQKPEALLHRVILSCTAIGETVLDPFSGTGTTAAVARRLGRHFIGIEQDAGYAAAARARIAAIEPLSEEAAATVPTKREQPRLPFGNLVERGIVPPGATLTDKLRRWRATVAADGSITCGRARGSIHGVGAAVQEAPSCNGWVFWHVEQAGRLRVLDEFRQDMLRGH